jgi:hypothetical protein
VQNWFQMSVEGLSTLILVFRLNEVWQIRAFQLALVAVLLPILCTLYDSFVVPLVAWYMSGGTLSSLGKTIVGMVTALQGCAIRAALCALPAANSLFVTCLRLKL